MLGPVVAVGLVLMGETLPARCRRVKTAAAESS